jgi:hypothetical protein
VLVPTAIVGVRDSWQAVAMALLAAIADKRKKPRRVRGAFFKIASFRRGISEYW